MGRSADAVAFIYFWFWFVFVGFLLYFISSFWTWSLIRYVPILWDFGCGILRSGTVVT